MIDNIRVLEAIRDDLNAVYNREIDGEDYDFNNWICDHVAECFYIVGDSINYNLLSTLHGVELHLMGYDCIEYASEITVILNTKNQELRVIDSDGKECISVSAEICNEITEVYRIFYEEEEGD